MTVSHHVGSRQEDGWGSMSLPLTNLTFLYIPPINYAISASDIFHTVRYSNVQGHLANLVVQDVLRNVATLFNQFCTALEVGMSQVRFPIMSLKFFVDIILPAALWPWVGHRLQQQWVPGIFPGGKCDRCVGMTTLSPSCTDCFEIWEPQSPGTVRTCTGL
jgi:hypothetical protein